MAEITKFVRMEDIPQVVSDTLIGVRDGLLRAREQGIIAEWPKTVDFNMTVIKDFELLESQDAQVTESLEKQGGFQTQTEKSGGTDTKAVTSTSTKTGSHSHVQNGDSEQRNYGT